MIFPKYLTLHCLIAKFTIKCKGGVTRLKLYSYSGHKGSHACFTSLPVSTLEKTRCHSAFKKTVRFGTCYAFTSFLSYTYYYSGGCLQTEFQVIKSVYVQVIPETQALDSPKNPIVLQGCFSYCWDVRHSRSLIQSFRQLHQPADHTFRFSESCLKGAKAAGENMAFYI